MQMMPKISWPQRVDEDACADAAVPAAIAIESLPRVFEALISYVVDLLKEPTIVTRHESSLSSVGLAR
jgi:hypothetical protein